MRTVLVVDASVVVALLLQLDLSSEAARSRVEADTSLAAPELLDLEVTSVLRRLVRASRLSGDRAAQAIVDLGDLPVRSLPHTPPLPRCWALRENLTPYDAAYVAAAETLDAVLLTADARLARAPGVRCPVEIIG